MASFLAHQVRVIDWQKGVSFEWFSFLVRVFDRRVISKEPLVVSGEELVVGVPLGALVVSGEELVVGVPLGAGAVCFARQTRYRTQERLVPFERIGEVFEH